MNWEALYNEFEKDLDEEIDNNPTPQLNFSEEKKNYLKWESMSSQITFSTNKNTSSLLLNRV